MKNARKKLIFLTIVALFTSYGLSGFAQDPQAREGASSVEERVQADLKSGHELYRSGNWYTAQEAFQNAYDAAPENSNLKAQATFDLSGILWEQGDYSGAYKKVNEAIRRAEQVKLNNWKPQLLLRKGHIEASRGQFSRAYSSFQQCADAAKPNADDELAALCRMGMHYINTVQGKKERSEKKFQSDLAFLKGTSNPVLVGISLSKIAELQTASGQLNSALALLQQALIQFEKTDNVPAAASTRLSLAEVYQNINRWQDAGKDLKDLLIVFKNMNNRPALVTTYILLAKQAEHEGDGEKAYANLKQALHYAASIASPQRQGQARLALCEFFSRTENPERGITDCKIARSVYKKQNMGLLATRALIGESRLEHSSGLLQEAERGYRESIKELKKFPKDSSIHDQIITQYTNLCVVSMGLDSPSALDDCNEALKLLDDLKTRTKENTQMLVQTLVRTAMAEQEKGKKEDAKAHYQRAITQANPEDSATEIATALIGLSELASNSDEQIKYLNKGIKLLSQLKSSVKLGTRESIIYVNAHTALAQIYLDQSNWDESIKALNTLISISKKVESWDRTSWGYLGLARAYQATNQPEQAQKALEEGYPYAEKSSDPDMMESYNKALKKKTKK